MKQRCHKSHYKKGKTVMTVKLRFDEADHDCPELICYLADKFNDGCLEVFIKTLIGSSMSPGGMFFNDIKELNDKSKTDWKAMEIR